MEQNISAETAAVVEDYNCSECGICVSSSVNKCPECGETMWRRSQVKSMGQFFTIFFGGLGLPLFSLMFLISVVGLAHTLVKGGNLRVWLASFLVFGFVLLLLLRVLKFVRKMAREGIYDKKLQAKGGRMLVR